MRYLKISNKGLLDPKLIPLMGGTTKTGLDTIGEFGTGLKYVLAYCSRNNIDLKLYINKEQVKIETINENIAGHDFGVLHINGERTSITDKMGKDWELWMIIREVYSNALDEGSAYYELVNKVSEEEELKTCFYFELNSDVLNIYNSWTDYFIQSKAPIWENNDYAIYPQQGSFRLYKQGILIKENKDQTSIFNYDIKHAQINELRQYTGSSSLDLCKALSSIDDVKTIIYFLDQMHLVEKDKLSRAEVRRPFEFNIDLDWSNYNFDNDSWNKALTDIKIIDVDSYDNLKDKSNFDIKELLVLPKNFFRKLMLKRSSIGAVRSVKQVGSFFEIINDTLFNKVKKARKVLEDADYHIHPELNFIFGEFGNKNVLAKVDLDEKLVYISSKVEEISMFQLIAILIEENEHFQTGFDDETRQFQQHFINLYTKQLMNKIKLEI